MPDQTSSYLRANFEAFQNQLPALIDSHRG